MRLLRFALISLAVLFLIVTGISLLIPSHIRLSRAINIHTTRTAALQQLNNPAKWKNWFPGLDTAQLYTEGNKAVGAMINGKSKALLIITHTDTAEVVAEFRSNRPTVVNGWKTITHPQVDSLTVQWYMDIHLSWYPWVKFSSLLFEKSYGTRMELGLGRLKNILEE